LVLKTQSGDHGWEDVEKVVSIPREDLAKSGYKNKVKIFNHPSIFF
jgi:hypothetical protein